jgi:TrmH family RNA methyltransferase
VRTRNPLNIGAVARAMSNFGFSRLRVVAPYEVAFREARSAVGAADVLASAEEFHSIAEAVADCSLVVGTTAAGQRELHHPIRRLDDSEARDLITSAAGPVALLFGSEKVGLSNHDLSFCHWLLRIPTCEANISMNLGQSIAVCLYELVRNTNPKLEPPPGEFVRAEAKDLDRLTTVLTEALHASGYTTVAALPSTEEKTRRLIRRLNLSTADCEVLLGMLRQISWKP